MGFSAMETWIPKYSFDLSVHVGTFNYPSPPPIRKFSGYLKNIDASLLPDHKRAFLNIICPHFFNRFVFKHELDALRNYLSGKKLQEAGSLELPRYSERRYAGGYDLPRGSYYSLWDPDKQTDHGTLRSELIAYQDLVWSGLHRIEDTQYFTSKDDIPEHFEGMLPKYTNHIIAIIHHA